MMHQNKKLQLLICTQAVDKDDPVLGFFVRWIEEFAKHCGSIEVLCLREGEHALPVNVRVHTLGQGKALRILGLLRESLVLRKQYNAVFVHMNPEYLVAAGWFWRLIGKKTALWYTHKNVDLKLRIATLFANIIFTASKESFRLQTKKLHIMGHGIDTDFFSPEQGIPRGEHWLSAGRLSKSKRHDLAIRAAAREGKELHIAGEGSERQNLEVLARELGATVRFVGGLNQVQLRREYRAAALLLHTSETGSLDKVTLEALSCGCPVRTNDSALKYLENESPEYVRAHHSLSTLISRMLALY